MTVGIHAVDVQGKTIIYNDHMRKMEGIEITEFQDHSLIDIFQFGQQSSTLLEVLATQQPIVTVKQTYWNRHGQEITTINDTYPVHVDGKLIGAIELAHDVTTLEQFVYQPLKRYGEPITFSIITAISESMISVKEMAKKAAHAKLSVLLLGESGTGKDLIAEAIHHEWSPGASNFYTLYCHNADANMLDQLHAEMIEREPSTIFCERIDLLSLHHQQKLLEVVQDPRLKQHFFLASTGKDPVELITSGELWKELYYFFASMLITVPPLRDRKEDIVPFVEDYFMRHSIRFGTVIKGLSKDVTTLFHKYDWPGNLKELEFLLDEIASFVTDEEWVTYDLLPLHFKRKLDDSVATYKQMATKYTVESDAIVPLEVYLKAAESEYVVKVMEKFNGNVTKAAAALGMSRQNLQYRLRKIRN
ncbi:sigma 54-interacting transcriptional regulator [Paenisporosarcina cavernae]|uniref:Transcriptional regulator n=1 Tax=Paenisporosarcina cavernae TaxID=2320858 RepID=A0A385YYR8_9BACL|nr:sigma 54-interacting transcriptional regulator [Paenisporosarcina cavernae]AYC30808.1 transcriptional regulator [Paenisporosarcina cavernae]